MKKSDPAFEGALQDATEWLMDEFYQWNEVQGELSRAGYPNNHYSERDMAAKRRVFAAIAERFVLEGVDWRPWQWFETPWAGTDGNTGMEAYVVDFTMRDPEEAGLGILAFYAARNRRGWYAVPLVETTNEDGLATYEANAIQDALDALQQLEPAEQHPHS